MSEDDDRSVSARSWRAVRWNYIGNAVRTVCQFVIGVVLARLLGPEAFGTVALAWLMIGVGMLFSDLGLGVVLIQRPEIDENDVRFVFVLQVIIGIALSLLGVAVAPFLAAWLGQPQSVNVFRVMSTLFAVQGVGATPIALLRRRLDFRRAQLISVWSYLLGYLVIGVPCALYGCGAWSLVAAQLAQGAASSLLSLWRYPYSLMPRWSARSSGLFAMGLKVVGSNLTSYALGNVDSLVVGRQLGVDALGVYSRAGGLVTAPAAGLIAGVQGVLFSACSRAQSAPAKLRKAYLGVTSVMAAISFPVFLTVCLVPHTVIGAIYGPKWLAAAPLLRPIALTAAISALSALVGPVLTATSNVHLEWRAQIIALLVMTGGVVAAGQVSAAAVAWAVLAVQLVRWLLLAREGLRVLGADWNDLFSSVAWPLCVAIPVACSTAAVDAVSSGLAYLPRLAIDVVTAALALIAGARFAAPRWLRGEHGGMLLAMNVLPSRALRWVGL